VTVRCYVTGSGALIQNIHPRTPYLASRYFQTDIGHSTINPSTTIVIKDVLGNRPVRCREN
jgi:hypothetical protein